MNIARFLSVVDPDGLSDKALFVKTLADGNQGFIRQKPIEFYLPDNVTTSFSSSDPLFTVGGQVTGSGTGVWTFDPINSSKETSDIEVSIDGNKLLDWNSPLGNIIPAKIIAQGTGVQPIEISLELDDFKKKLTQYINDYQKGLENPTGAFIEELNLALGTKGTITAFVDDKAKELLDAVTKDFSPLGTTIKVVPSGGGDIKIIWDNTISQFGLTSFDRNNVLLDKFLSNKISVSPAAREFAFAEYLNQKYTGETVKVNIEKHIERFGYINLIPPFITLGPGTSFGNFTANTVSHELGHAFGLNEAYIKKITTIDEVKLNFRGSREPYDIMQALIPSDPNLDFAPINILTLKASIGLTEQKVGSLSQAIELFKDNFNLNGSDSGIDGLRIAEPDLPSPYLGLNVCRFA